VKGSTGNWCGAGMMKGEIWVDKHAGQNTGEWMQAGEIRIDGFIGSMGKHLFGGRIYQQGKLIFGGNPVDHLE
jgi:formylmethanofuran dehydrogenase subunit C